MLSRSIMEVSNMLHVWHKTKHKTKHLNLCACRLVIEHTRKYFVNGDRPREIILHIVSLKNWVWRLNVWFRTSSWFRNFTSFFNNNCGWAHKRLYKKVRYFLLNLQNSGSFKLLVIITTIETVWCVTLYYFTENKADNQIYNHNGDTM